MIRAIALANMNTNIGSLIKDQVYLVEDVLEDVFYKKYYKVYYSLDKVYIGFIRKEWFILESIHLGRLREKQINSIFS